MEYKTLRTLKRTFIFKRFLKKNNILPQLLLLDEI